MREQIANGVMTIIVQAIMSILGVFAAAVMTAVVQYLNKKKEEVVNKIGVDKYNHIYNVAKATFFAVEQNFSGLSGMREQKRKLFDSMLLQKMPHLTQQELDHFREGIVGEINYQLSQSQLLGPAAAMTGVPAIAQPDAESNNIAPGELIVSKEAAENPAPAEQTNVTAANTP